MNHLFLEDVNLLLDMDGVIADFLSSYLVLGEKIGMPVKPPFSDNTRNPDLFRKAVLDHDIFLDLDLMPKAYELLDLIREKEQRFGLKIELLSCLNSKEPDVISKAREQKIDWLKKHNIEWKPNFVLSNKEKSNYAKPTNILIDDSMSCITPFLNKGGLTVLYQGLDEDFKTKLNGCINSAILENKSHNIYTKE